MWDFLTDEKFTIPFLSTLGASLTILALGFFSRFFSEQKKKIYATNYIADICFTLLHSEYILLRHTIIPHITATKRMVDGDKILLDKAFAADEFDILNAAPMKIEHLNTDMTITLGYSNFKLVRMFETLIYLHQNDANRLSLNFFVKENLKSALAFYQLPEEKQIDALLTYYDYLGRLEHESKRIIIFIARTMLPEIKDYSSSCAFLLFSTRNINDTVSKVENLMQKNLDITADNSYIENVVRQGGIQSAL